MLPLNLFMVVIVGPEFGAGRVDLTNRLRVIDRLYPRRNKSRSDFRSDTRGGEGEAANPN